MQSKHIVASNGTSLMLVDTLTYSSENVLIHDATDYCYDD